MSPVTLATAWSKQHDFVASTIVGVSREDQLADIFAAIDLTLPDDVMKAVKNMLQVMRIILMILLSQKIYYMEL